MANCFHLCVKTPEGTAYDGQAEYCNLPTAGGSVGILADHAPMLCALTGGEMRFRDEGGAEKSFRLSAGVANVRANTVTVLTDRAEA